ncbi:MAG: class IV adenylate cyclase [Sphaerochaeta sp.]|nr:class IV adenylate cyclase [Sphaerochaeta sp.]
MALEVELKAHVAEPLLLQQRIEALAGISLARCELKEDTYLSREGEDALFRIRAEQSGRSFETMEGVLVFTYKNKAIKNGIEVNEEVEFTSTSDQGEAALQFFLSLGYVTYITKTKKGYLYTYTASKDLPPLTIELVEIATLGWFIEMEFVLEDHSRVNLAKKTLLDLLTQLGIKHSKIESEYYMHLLKKNKPEA